MTLTWISETWKAPFIPAYMSTKRSRVIVFREVAGLPSVCQCRTVSVFIAVTASFKEVVLLFQYLYIASTLRGEKAERWHLAKKASTRPYVHKTRPSTLTKSTEQIRSRVFVQLTYPLNNGRMMFSGAWREIRTLVAYGNGSALTGHMDWCEEFQVPSPHCAACARREAPIDCSLLVFQRTVCQWVTGMMEEWDGEKREGALSL